MRRRAVQMLAAALLALLVMAPPALAAAACPEPPKKVHCNAGNGNGNEGCDPGNSTLHNRGGDEIGAPARRGGSQPNPGGNNVLW
ncbi:hypothetical protein Rxycam_02613 [Rubrobacter xylanophilus DSM 9941]|uniref:Uncharacterized protein n=1 Tax=Rubrobacter xylanophilus TaxID=49319 RepID=A0A510HMF2_9ACTN|nr:hypothetical protein [Rubrobacter xylanophilus]QYJ16778.1 hypothetical protein Rxycam_02613 [Rubrobacter xylanophilus DSM 9941]BBL81084.1 hypothetical protein RxyAA322_29380 [Rubrobacter xylanophilus]